MTIREGAWDCPYCDRKLNRGPHAYCGACGAPRDKSVKFYLPEGARLVEDEAELKRAASGPDWNCQYCQADNPGYQNFCTGCGGGADGSAPRTTSETIDAPRQPAAAVDSKGGEKPKSSCLAPGMALLVVLLLVLFNFAFRSTSAEATVAGLSWERTATVEQLKTRTDERWVDELPNGARVLSRSNELHSHRQVQVGTETKTRTVEEQVQTGTRTVKIGTKDLGNGYFEDITEEEPVYETVSREETYEEPLYREEPVYRDRVRFEFDEWELVHSETSSGGRDLEPHWPEVEAVGPKQREGERVERYLVEFTLPDGGRADYETSSNSEWEKFQEGQLYRVRLRGEKVVSVEPVS